MTVLASGRRNIVVLGAGFAGITALLKLYRKLRKHGLLTAYHLILVNRTAHHLYAPALYEIASIPRGSAEAVAMKTAICIQIDDILARLPGVSFIGEAASSLDPERHVITLASGDQLNFEYALVALGAETNFFNIPGLAEAAYPLKIFADAVRLRNRAEDIFAHGSGALRVIIGGGGATGVELAAEFARFFAHLAKRAGMPERRVEISIVEAAPTILSGFAPGTARRAEKRLQRLGVRITTGTAVRQVSASGVLLADDRMLPCELLVWSGGVLPARVLTAFELPLDRRGGIITNEYLEAKSGIYAIGDNASFINPKTGVPLPANVPVAEAEARVAAANIIAELTGKQRRPFRPLAHYPFILAVGGKYALADLILIKCPGFLGWLLKQLVELRYLLFVLPFKKAMRMWLRALSYSTAND